MTHSGLQNYSLPLCSWNTWWRTPFSCVCMCVGVAFLILDDGGGTIIYTLKCSKPFECFILFYRRSSKTSICEVLYDKSLSKTFSSSRISSLSFSPVKHWSKTVLGSPPDEKSISWYLSVCVVGLKAQALSLSLNVPMLYDNMEQLTKLHMSIFDLLAWTNYSSKFIITNIKDASKFAKYFKMHI